MTTDDNKTMSAQEALHIAYAALYDTAKILDDTRFARAADRLQEIADTLPDAGFLRRLAYNQRVEGILGSREHVAVALESLADALEE